MNNANWQVATLQKAEQVSEHMRGLTFTFDEEQSFKAGQHYDIRLTASDGYQAERSYSIANAPDSGGMIELGVELLPDGEVSPYLWHIKLGDKIEMRGPIGGHFVWDTDLGSVSDPLILIGGGSGLVPIMSILRHHIAQLDKDAGRNILVMTSSRTYERIPYWQELQEHTKKDPNTKVVVTITDKHPENWTGYIRRIDPDMIKDSLGQFQNFDKTQARVYICGNNKFVDAIAKAIIANGIMPSQIKTERYGG